MSSSAKQSSNPFESFQNLREITYGMEIEQYIFATQKREAFLETYQNQIEIEQRSRVKSQLLLGSADNNAACLCVAYKQTSHGLEEIMQVRLDGEKEFAFLNKENINRESEPLFHVEFISSGAGIKNHEDFFNDIHKNKASEAARVVNGFSSAVKQAKKNLSKSIEITDSSSKEKIIYIFPEWVSGFLNEERGILQPRKGATNTLIHVTHSLPIVSHRDYLTQLGNTFGRKGDEDPLTITFPSKNNNISTTREITDSRNNTQPLFKSPRDHFINHSEKESPESLYLIAAREGKVLQPTSNRLDFLKKDIEIYTQVMDALIEEERIIYSEKAVSPLASKFSKSKEIEILGNTIEGLTKIVKQHTNPPEQDKLVRVFESHDEKLQLLYTKPFAGQGEVYHGLLENRERMSLVKYVSAQFEGKGSRDAKEVLKYLHGLDIAIHIAAQNVEMAVQRSPQTSHSKEESKGKEEAQSSAPTVSKGKEEAQSSAPIVSKGKEKAQSSPSTTSKTTENVQSSSAAQTVSIPIALQSPEARALCAKLGRSLSVGNLSTPASPPTLRRSNSLSDMPKSGNYL